MIQLGTLGSQGTSCGLLVSQLEPSKGMCQLPSMDLDPEDEFGPFEDDLEALLRLQDILLQAAEGARDPDLNREYQHLRGLLLADPIYATLVPKFVKRHRDLNSMWPALKSFSPQWEPRRVEVREQFEPLLQEAEQSTLFGNMVVDDLVEAEVIRSGRYDSSAWTGATRPAERLAAVRTLMPVAVGAVEQLLNALEAPGHNGGPPLDEKSEAITQLRQLHGVLGSLLEAAEEGNLTRAINQGLPAEAARYAKRVAKNLRDDPIPYAVSASILAILTACGMPGIGGFLSGVAVNMRKRVP